MFSPKLTSVVDKKIPIPGSDATITIKRIKPGIMQAIVQSTMQVTSKQQGDTDKMASEISFSLFARNRAIVTECLTNWQGFKDESDRPLKFTALNVAKMMDESDDFIDFVIKEHEELSEEVEAETVVAEKN